jgi:hypothetical protein
VLAVSAAREDAGAWRTPAGVGLADALGPRPTAPGVALARWVLAVRAAGRLPAAGASAAAAALAAGQDPATGAVAGAAPATAWTVLALAATGAPGAGARDAGAAALRGLRNPDGGWGSAPGVRSDVPSTAAALQALAASGALPADPVVRDGRAWLLAARRADGGWGPLAGARASTGAATAWAALAVWAMGESPARAPWTRGRRGPLRLLAARQLPDGGVPDAGRVRADLVATCAAVLALRGRPLPVLRPGRGTPPDRAPRVVRREPAPGDLPGRVVTVSYRDDPGGTGVDPRRVRLTVGGRDLTRVASISALSLQVPGAAVGPLPAPVVLRLADRAGNARVVRWTIGPGGS